MERAKLSGTSRIRRSIQVSTSGLTYAFRNEVAIREQVFVLALLVPVSVFLPVSPLEHLLLVLAPLLVLLVEFLNTAIEATVDRISLDEHPLSGLAKDLANVAVVIALLMMCLCWGVIVGPVLWRSL